MLSSVLRRATGRMKRKAEKCKPTHARERGFRLRLRGHAAAERFAAGDQRKVRQQAQGRGRRSADRCMGKLRRIWSPATALHVGKLVAQSCQASQSEPPRHICYERMIHSRSGAVRQHVAGSCAWWRLEQAGNANGVVNFNTDRVGSFRSHESIPSALHTSQFGAEIFNGRQNFSVETIE